MARLDNRARIAVGLALSAWAGVLSGPAPAAAETVEELQNRLAAQEQMNLVLMQRIETLEAELEGRRPPAPPSFADIPESEPEADSGMDALDRTFVRRGVAVLPEGRIELAPALLWSHTDSSAVSPGEELFGVGMDARIGLGAGWMAGASVPVFHRSIGDKIGHASGIGDVSASLWKSLMVQDESRPSLVASLRYTTPTGSIASVGGVPLGSGLHQLTAGLSSVKTIAPIALTGGLRYTKVLGDRFRSVDVNRSDIFGAAIGANLAVTPDISVSTGFDVAFGGGQRLNGIRIDGSGRAQALLEIGVGAVLGRNVLLTFGSAIGIAGDSPDLTLSLSLPVRF